MFVIVARCASLYGILDTEDFTVEWQPEEALRSFVSQGVPIQGVEEGTINVSKLYCIPYENATFGNEASIFDSADRVTKGSRGNAEIHIADKVYKVRPLKRVQATDMVVLGEESVKADKDGVFVKLSNGVCTIIPEDIFQRIFNGVFSLEDIK